MNDSLVVPYTSLTAIADAIRDKTGKSAEMTVGEMPEEIEGIETGGGGSVGELVSEITLSQCDQYVRCASQAVTKVTIAEGEEKIGNSAFVACTKLKEIKIPDSVIKIDSQAFSQCTCLEEIVLPKSLQTLGQGAFSNCTALTKVEIPDSVTTLESSVFDSCSALGEVKLPKTITSIPDSAFLQCYSLRDIAIPENVTTIGGSAFFSCMGLKTITIPENVTIIGGNAFQQCQGLRVIQMKSSTPPTLKSTGALPVISTGQSTGQLHYIIVPDDAVDAYKSASNWSSFAGIIQGESDPAVQNWEEQMLVEGLECGTDLTCSLTLGGVLTVSGTGSAYTAPALGDSQRLVVSATLPQTVTSIGASAFTNQTCMSDVTLPAGILSLGSSAFSGCYGLRAIDLPEGLSTISQGVFSRCIALSTIIVPGSVSTLSSGTFSGCTSLKEVTLQEGVKGIGSSVFEYCQALVEIDLPEGLTTIGSIGSGTRIASLTIPSTVTSIDSGALTGCTWLETLTILNDTGGSPPRSQLNAFSTIKCIIRVKKVIQGLPGKLTAVVVRKGYGDAYKAAYPAQVNRISESED